jgi:hypothetical protein
MKTIVAALGAGLIAAALLGNPAEARSFSSGYSGSCANGARAEIRHDRMRLWERRAELRQDRRHMRHLRARLHRDIYAGSSMDAARDLRAMRLAHREMRMDRRDLRHARRELRQDRLGY